MGTSITSRVYGETLASIAENYGRWFTPGFVAWSDREDELPVDQHMLVALMAPRPVFIGSAAGDSWSDPEGEYLAAWEALPAWKLYGIPHEELPGPRRPRPGKAFMGLVASHLWPGPHGITSWDWRRYVDWANRYVRER
jgi:hypothetical protein